MSDRRETMAEPDVLLIGGGVMSATLGVMLHQLDPTLTIQIVEALDEVARESSNPWNNAGTGHAALCELNYTKERADGSYDISKAIEVNEAFEQSKQLWAHLAEKGLIGTPESFIQSVPHMSFVRGAENQAGLKRRYETMSDHHFFKEMVYSEDHDVIGTWAPLLTAGRPDEEPIAATKVDSGTDVNFGALTRTLVAYLDRQSNVRAATRHHVRDIRKQNDGRWKVTVKNLDRGIKRDITTKFVFVGAGGASLPLLQKSGIPEGKGFGGFPVSGQFLVCDEPETASKHRAKVYGKAAVGAPPMSVPHLDTRVIDGKRSLLFGPFAGFSPKFLKTGSIFDLPSSVRLSNIAPMLAVGKNNIDLTKYLIEQVMQSDEDRIDALREFVPNAISGHWRLATAGQRVQIIKQDKKKGGTLQFGTEVVSAADGSLAALLGASPGASTAVNIMLEVIEKCFADRLPEWQDTLQKMIPSYGVDLAADPAVYRTIRAKSDAALGLS